MIFTLDRPGVLLLLLLLPALIYYFLRQKGGNLHVTTYLTLWEKAALEVTLWERFLARLPEWRLIFTMLAILSLGIAVAGPSYKQPGGGTYHLVLDSSASMLTKLPDGSTRFAQAKKSLLNFLLQRTANDKISFLAFEEGPRVIIPPTHNIDQIQQAVANLQAQPVVSDFASLPGAFHDVSGEVILFSDGIGLNKQALDAWPQLVVFGIGDAVDNQGIDSLAVHDVWPREKVDIEVLLRNAAPQPSKKTLRLYLQNLLIAEHAVEIPASGKLAQTFTIQRDQGGIFALQLDPVDAYEVDDHVGAMIASPPQLPLVLISQGQTNPFLRAIGETLAKEQGKELLIIASPDQVQDEVVFLAEGGNWSLSESGRGRYLLFGSQVDSMVQKSMYEMPTVIDWSTQHPITQNLHFDLLHCSKALHTADNLHALVKSTQGALIYADEIGENRIVGTSFALEDSNFPLQINFPLFVRRAYAWLLANASLAPNFLLAGQTTNFPLEDAFWQAPYSLGPVTTPWGESYINFFSAAESPTQSGFPPSWSRRVATGPGIYKELATFFLILSAVALAMALGMDFLVRPAGRTKLSLDLLSK